MSMKLNTKEIKQLLNRSAAQLDNGTLDKLQSARRTALQYQQTEQQAPVLAWLTEHGVIHHHSAPFHKAYNLGMAALLLALLVGGALYWQQSYDHDHSDIDIAILTDDLPVDMYVD
jgi:non-ribosomal peptide synthetase component F